MELNFDLKGKIEELAKKIKEDPALTKNFQSDPVKTVEKLIGIDLPDEKLQPVVAGIKAQLASSKLGDKLGDLKKLF